MLVRAASGRVACRGSTRPSARARPVSIRQHTSAYVRICQHTSAYARIRQHTSAYVRIQKPRRISHETWRLNWHTSAYVSIRQHTSAYETSRLNWPVTQHALRALLMASNAYLRFLWKSSESTRLQYTSAYVRIRQHSSAYVSIRQHPGILVGEQRVNAAAAPQVSVFVLLY